MISDIRKLAIQAEARVEWCIKKLAFERKRRKALDDMVRNEDWLDGKVPPRSERPSRLS